MKIAVLGSGPLGLEAAIHFEKLGAHVTLFANNELGGMVKRVNNFAPETSMEFPWSHLTTSIGRESIGLSCNEEDIPSVGEYFNDYLSPLVKKGNSNIVIKPGQVQRVHKRFLSLDEEVPGKSRLHDLFRVVFSTDPETNILKQVEDNPEVFEKLGKEVLNSLNEAVESFDDFDLVIDATGTFSNANPLGPSRSPALNEQRIKSSSNIFYGRDCLESYEKTISSSKHIVLVGTGALSALLLCELDLWLEEDKTRTVTLVSTELRPFEGLLESKECNTLSLLSVDVLKKYYAKLEEDRRVYESDLFKWRDLDPHVRVKTPEPKIPVSQLNIIPASNVTALDKLLDQEGLFATLESNSFRKSSNESEEYINTLACDTIFVCTGHSKNYELVKGLRIDDEFSSGLAKETTGAHSEPGFFTLGSTVDRKSSLVKGLSQIPEIEKEIMKFFSRA
jgi:hypothetical protein